MKTFLTILVIILTAFLVYLYIHPFEREIHVPRIVVKESPEVYELRNKVSALEKDNKAKRDTLRNFAFKRIIVKGDTSFVLKETLVHDTAYLLSMDVIISQDSLLAAKDSLIHQLSKELSLSQDSIYYFKALVYDEKSKTKCWQRVGIGSGLINLLLILFK